MERLALRDQILDGLDTIFRRLDLDPALVLVVRPKRMVPSISAMIA
jgi:hypothetical protein